MYCIVVNTFSRSHNSVPQTVFLWYVNGKLVHSFNSSLLSEDVNEKNLHKMLSRRIAMNSTYDMVPSKEDNKKIVSCTAHNPKLPEDIVEDHIMLNVLCEYWIFWFCIGYQSTFLVLSNVNIGIFSPEKTFNCFLLCTGVEKKFETRIQ